MFLFRAMILFNLLFMFKFILNISSLIIDLFFVYTFLENIRKERGGGEGRRSWRMEAIRGYRFNGQIVLWMVIQNSCYGGHSLPFTYVVVEPEGNLVQIVESDISEIHKRHSVKIKDLAALTFILNPTTIIVQSNYLF